MLADCVSNVFKSGALGANFAIFIFKLKQTIMKKISLVAILMVFGVITASAQLLPSLQFGIKAGANFSQLKDDGNWFNASTRTGYLVGAWARLGGAGLHFQPELYVTSKGSEGTYEGEKGKFNFTTLDLPLLLGTRIGVGPIAARIQAGPVVSFVMNQDNSFREALEGVGRFKDYKNQNISLTGGLGLDVSKFRADLRYEHGLSDVFKKDSEGNGKLSLWTLSIGYRLL